MHPKYTNAYWFKTHYFVIYPLQLIQKINLHFFNCVYLNAKQNLIQSI